ncbi:hypothetical protein MKX01_030051 [Papaver californicum]|nr:hypothetical protein MKX01_030051 [Papaver californicum]
MDTKETVVPLPPPLEAPPSPPPPPPETPPSPPPQTPPSFVNPNHFSQMQRDRGSFWVPSQPPPPLQSHRPFSSFSSQRCGMQRPVGAHSHFEQGMVPLAMSPPLAAAQTCRMPFSSLQYLYFLPPAQMTNHGFVDNFRPLNLGEFPPWHIIVTIAGRETGRINIPNLEGNRVIGLPLGFDVPEVIAGHYERLLRMVQDMRDVITDTVRDLARSQQDAARFWQDANRYYCELEELKFKNGWSHGGFSGFHGMFFSLDMAPPVSPTKKRKMIPGESVPWEAKVAQFHQPEHLTLSIRSRGDNENDILITSVKCLQEKFVNKETSLYCSEVQTETGESLEFAEPIAESVEATMTSSSTMCQTVEATMTPSPAMCQTEGFEFVDNILKIPKEYENLYKNILGKYGHMVTRKVTKSNDATSLTLVVRLLKIISAMDTMPVAELSELLLERWEGDIKAAETLEFNIKWLRQKFNEVKKFWKLDKDIERHEQELDSVQLKYVGLCARKEELDKEIAEVKVQIRKSEEKIASEREAIQEKLAQIYDQIHNESVQGTVLG